MACSPRQSARAAAYTPASRHSGDLGELVVRGPMIVRETTNGASIYNPSSASGLLLPMLYGETYPTLLIGG